MDKNTVVGLARRYADAVRQRFDPEKVVLFGSYARNAAHTDSDIDIAVVFNGFHGDWSQTASSLWGLTWKVSTFIEPILIDRSSADRSGFIEHILTTGEIIYERAQYAQLQITN